VTAPNGSDDEPSDRDEHRETPSVEIERVAPADIDELVALWVDLATGQRSYGSHILPERNRTAVRDTLAGHAAAGGVRAARCDGEAVGFVSFALERGAYESDETRGIVHNLYVAPGFRGDGIGSDLLDAAEAALEDAGASIVALEAMADNEAARRFYRRRGYADHRVELEKSVRAGTAASSGENDTHSKEG
jgi:ribosomal protein S18 acetylase RimI-like enzyme